MDQSLRDLARAVDGLRNGARAEGAGLEGAGRESAAESSPLARPDFHREERKGVPEVIYAEVKRPDHTVAIARAFLERRGRAIVSRVPPETLARLRDAFADAELVEYPAARLVVIRRGAAPTPRGGKVAIISAGTSDFPAAEEARALLVEMGCETRDVHDVGVAGIHRLIEPLQEVLAWGADAIVVAAGMDGALPSVVAGIVDVPVIGLPTSTGYGFGGQGVGALTTMLQTCAPGLAVVNIDNGVGAAATAGLIANRVAAARAAAAAST